MNKELETYLDKQFEWITTKNNLSKFDIEDVLTKLSNEIFELSDSINKLAKLTDKNFERLIILHILKNHEKRIKFLEEHLPKIA